MRFEANKAFPHPVLRPLMDGGQSSDFPGYGFQTTVEPEIMEDGSHIELNVSFDIKHPDILEAVSSGRAEFSVLVYCHLTYYRLYVGSSMPQFAIKIRAGDVDRSVELRPSVVVTTRIDDYFPTGLHHELGGHAWSIEAGSLLAQDYTVDFPASREYLRPITSIFQIAPDPGQPRGKFDIRFGDPVQIVINPEDNSRLAVARRQSEKRPVVMNSIYLPAVMALLSEALRLGSDAPPDRWFEVVRYKAEAADLDWDQLRAGRITLWNAAQALLDSPGRHLDFMIEDVQP